MVDTTNALPSITEPVVDRFRRWNPIWYRFIKPLLETVRRTDVQVTTVTSGLSTVTTELDAVQLRYGVEVNVNGRVTAALRLDGTPAGSTFAVLADKFVVVHPSINATTIQAFVVGLVNGASTVGINGNLVVDGTILARHIDVDSLDAITADVGTITAGVLRSSDGLMVIDLNNKTFVVDTA